MRMQGQQVFRWAVEKIHHVAQRACTMAGVTTDDIDVFVPHQANLRIGTAIATKLGPGATRSCPRTSPSRATPRPRPSRSGCAGSCRAGRARSGQLALLVGFGAGLTYAAQVIQLP